MMGPLRNLTVRGKLALAVGITTAFALVVACVFLALQDRATYREVFSRMLMTQVNTVATSLDAVLAFGDSTYASEYLRGFQAHSNILLAVVCDEDGRELARHPPGMTNAPLIDPARESDGAQFLADRLVALKTVTLDGQRVGKVYLESALTEFRARQRQYIRLVPAVLMAALSLALIVFLPLSRRITDPIIDLAETAKRVADQKDYSVRATRKSGDELGHLTDCFNEMLGQIQRQDQALQEARNDLELRVVERTAAFSEANQRLKIEMEQRSRLEQQLRQSQKMEAVGQLAGGIAHDFNNILSVILGHTSLLLSGEGEGLTSESSESLREIESSAKRAANLTRQLLTFSRRQRLDITCISLNKTLTNLAKLLQRLLGEHIALECHYQPDLPSVEADVHMLEQVVMNLAVNARDAMPNGGTLTLSTEIVNYNPRESATPSERKRGSFVVLRVTDTGCGMSEETLKHIYEPFFTTKPVGKGTGLGLATVYGIVKQHQGWIEVQSVLNQGTTFSVFLPVATRPNAPVEAQERSLTPGAGSEIILLVEDEQSVRHIAARCLKQQGYHVLEATNGVQALEIWAEHKEEIDLLLTDMVMPEGVNGRELAQALRQDKPDLKVIYSSGYSDEINRLALDSTRGATFLAKPYIPEKLIRTVRESLNAQP
ncbi:MAG TPA: response regulator [Candidatus Paceibacterota bacterium]|nr:response regulator [Candidatus Paceibacterota bacterium]